MDWQVELKPPQTLHKPLSNPFCFSGLSPNPKPLLFQGLERGFPPWFHVRHHHRSLLLQARRQHFHSRCNMLRIACTSSQHVITIIYIITHMCRSNICTAGRPGALAVTETHVQFTSIGSKQPRCIPYAPPAQARRRHRRNVTFYIHMFVTSYIHMSSIRASITCTRLPFTTPRDSAAVTGASKRCRRKAAAGATALLSTRYGARLGAVARACDARCMRGRVYA